MTQLGFAIDSDDNSSSAESYDYCNDSIVGSSVFGDDNHHATGESTPSVGLLATTVAQDDISTDANINSNSTGDEAHYGEFSAVEAAGKTDGADLRADDIKRANMIPHTIHLSPSMISESVIAERLAPLFERLTALETANSKKDEMLADMATNITSLTTAKDQLAAENREKTAQITTLTSDIQQIRADNNENVMELSAMRTVNADLKTANDERTAQIAMLTTANLHLQSILTSKANRDDVPTTMQMKQAMDQLAVLDKDIILVNENASLQFDLHVKSNRSDASSFEKLQQLVEKTVAQKAPSTAQMEEVKKAIAACKADVKVLMTHQNIISDMYALCYAS